MIEALDRRPLARIPYDLNQTHDVGGVRVTFTLETPHTLRAAISSLTGFTDRILQGDFEAIARVACPCRAYGHVVVVPAPQDGAIVRIGDPAPG